MKELLMNLRVGAMTLFFIWFVGSLFAWFIIQYEKDKAVTVPLADIFLYSYVSRVKRIHKHFTIAIVLIGLIGLVGTVLFQYSWFDSGPQTTITPATPDPAFKARTPTEIQDANESSSDIKKSATAKVKAKDENAEAAANAIDIFREATSKAKNE